MIAPLPGLPSDPWRSASGREAACVLMDRGLCTTTRCPQSVTVFFEKRGCRLVSGEQRKIDQLVSIVAETERIGDRRNSSLDSRARISDGLRERFF